MVKGVTKVNPVAKAMMQSRRRAQVVPNKKKYNRKRDKNASENRQVPHQADKQEADDWDTSGPRQRQTCEIYSAGLLVWPRWTWPAECRTPYEQEISLINTQQENGEVEYDNA